MAETGLAPIKKRCDLAVSAAQAFRHFTENIHLWWPLATHSLSQEKAESVIFEAVAGGRIYEISRDGQEREWGRVLLCEEPVRLVFSWVLEKPKLATEVEVRFHPAGEKACSLVLVHRGWDKRPDGHEVRGNYASGWDSVLGSFANSLSAM